ncbi:MAG: cytochrome c5 family protein [Pseudomonadales bacterium]|nr:cytochrome c5 family protein [Pseudomonadales bacterium]
MVLALLIAGLAPSAFAGKVEDEVAARIKKVGIVCVQGDDCASGAAGAEVAAAGGGAFDAEATYGTTCATCHATGAAGAPKLGDVAAWAPRLEKGMDMLYDHAINGFNGMPAKGMCFTCSDDDIKALVDYLADGSK